jgi:hypothetical protein
MTEKTLPALKRDAMPINYSEPERRGSYEELLLKLKAVQEWREAGGGSDLDAAFADLSVVICFLKADHDVRETRAALPLEKLLLALADASKGGKPSMLYDVVRKAGPPVRPTEAVKRAQIIIMFEMLCDAGVEKPAEWLAAKLKAFGVEDANAKRDKDGIKRKTITPAKLERWRSELSGKSPEGSDEAYEYLRGRDKKRGERLSPAHAKSIVVGRLLSLLASGF